MRHRHPLRYRPADVDRSVSRHGCPHRSPMAVRDHDDLPLPLRAADHRPGAGGGDPRDAVGALPRSEVPAGHQVLGKAVRHQLRHRGGHRHRAGVPVRHELVELLPLCRRHLRSPAGGGRPGGFLPGVHLPGPVDLRLGPPLPPGPRPDRLAGVVGHDRLRLLDPGGQRLDAEPGGLPPQPGRLRPGCRCRLPRRTGQLRRPAAEPHGLVPPRTCGVRRPADCRGPGPGRERLAPDPGPRGPGLPPVLRPGRRPGARERPGGVPDRPLPGPGGLPNPADEDRRHGGTVGDRAARGPVDLRPPLHEPGAQPDRPPHPPPAERARRQLADQ